MSVEPVIVGRATLYNADCRDVLPRLSGIDAVVTDPPYPDFYVEEYGFDPDLLPSLNIQRGAVFWSARANFPLPYSGVHIWDKRIGVHGVQYERVFEIGGGSTCRVFRHSIINSPVTAQFAKDEFAGHPSQKPFLLMQEVIGLFKDAERIVDPFMGSGSTGVAAVKLGRNFIGIEREQRYFDIARRRIEDAQRQGDMFIGEAA